MKVILCPRRINSRMFYMMYMRSQDQSEFNKIREEEGEKIIPTDMVEQSISIYKEDDQDRRRKKFPVRSIYESTKEIRKIPRWMINSNGKFFDGTGLSESMYAKGKNQINYAAAEQELNLDNRRGSQQSLEVRDAGNVTIQDRQSDDQNSVLDIEEIRPDFKEVKLQAKTDKVMIAQDVLEDEGGLSPNQDIDQSIGTEMANLTN